MAASLAKPERPAARQSSPRRRVQIEEDTDVASERAAGTLRR
jgi:hypothetical protein